MEINLSQLVILNHNSVSKYIPIDKHTIDRHSSIYKVTAAQQRLAGGSVGHVDCGDDSITKNHIIILTNIGYWDLIAFKKTTEWME